MSRPSSNLQLGRLKSSFFFADNVLLAPFLDPSINIAHRETFFTRPNFLHSESLCTALFHSRLVFRQSSRCTQKSFHFPSHQISDNCLCYTAMQFTWKLLVRVNCHIKTDQPWRIPKLELEVHYFRTLFTLRFLRVTSSYRRNADAVKQFLRALILPKLNEVAIGSKRRFESRH